MNNEVVPTTGPVRVAAETFLIPNLAHAGDAYLPVNSLLIRGRQPIVVDTGAPIHREQWLDKVYSLVEPEDIRWVFLSHEDGDHTGGLEDILTAAPNATLVMNFFSTERFALERQVDIRRLMWRDPGESFDVGDRTLRLFQPPIFDGPATRGVIDERTGVMWAVDSFAAATPGALHHVDDIPADLYDESFGLFNSMVSPWHAWLDPVVYGRHVDSVERLAPSVVTSAHGPVLTGDAIGDALTRVRSLAGQPRVATPGQALLDELLATAVAA